MRYPHSMTSCLKSMPSSCMTRKNECNCSHPSGIIGFRPGIANNSLAGGGFSISSVVAAAIKAKITTNPVRT